MTQNWIDAAAADAVPEEDVIAVAVAGKEVALYGVDGEVYATDNICTHGNAMLTDGYQDGGTIECPFHGGAFDIATGAATVFPCQIPLKTYAVEVDDGWIAIRLTAPEAAA